LEILLVAGEHICADHQAAVDQVGGRHGRPQLQCPLFRGESEQIECAARREADQIEGQIQVGLATIEGGFELKVVGRQSRYLSPRTPIPAPQLGRAAVLHPDQGVCPHAIGQGEGDAVAEGVEGVGGPARAGIQVEEEVAVAVPVGAGPGQAQRFTIPGGVELLLGVERSAGRGVAGNAPVGADKGTVAQT
jgi:hypothetical protein